MLPKFLIADNSQQAEDRIFVVHTEAPRCTIESDIDDFFTDQEMNWNDDAIDGDELDEFLGEANVFFDGELPNEDDLYDDGYGDDEEEGLYDDEDEDQDAYQDEEDDF